MKNQYVRDVGNLKRRVKRYQKEFIQEKEDKKRRYGFKEEMNEINRVYSNYKELVKKYNKGEISEEQVKLSEEKLSQTISDYKSYFSKENKKDLYVQEEEILRLRIGSVKDIKDFDDTESLYKKVSDIINKAINKKNEKENTNDEFVTPQYIYDKIFGGAVDSPYYEEIKAHIAEQRTEFRQNILKDLKDGGYLTSKDETKINKLLSI